MYIVGSHLGLTEDQVRALPLGEFTRWLAFIQDLNKKEKAGGG